MKAISIALIACAAGLSVHHTTMAAQNEVALYSFCSQKHCKDGGVPYRNLIDVNGTFFGTTTVGGTGECNDALGCGTVFALDPKTGTEKVIYSFCSKSNCSDGESPYSGLISVNGLLYGTTWQGGNSESCYQGCGTAFSLDPDTGAETVLYSFCGQQNCADGAVPEASLINVNGTLYGTTYEGGSNLYFPDGAGTVYAINPSTGAETVVYSFCSQQGQQYCLDGQSPADSLVNIKGILYGTTLNGGIHSYGTVFGVDPKAGTENQLYSFCSQQNCADGTYPVAGLIDVKGVLYGTTHEGGASETGNCIGYGCGTVFAFDPGTGAETVLYSFCSRLKCRDGATPEASLIGINGTLYGTTLQGGTTGCSDNAGCGTVFSLAPKTGEESVLYSFCADRKCSDGQYPLASLIRAKGTLYGTTEFGGAYGYGTVFSIVP